MPKDNESLRCRNHMEFPIVRGINQLEGKKLREELELNGRVPATVTAWLQTFAILPVQMSIVPYPPHTSHPSHTLWQLHLTPCPPLPGSGGIAFLVWVLTVLLGMKLVALVAPAPSSCPPANPSDNKDDHSDKAEEKRPLKSSDPKSYSD